MTADSSNRTFHNPRIYFRSILSIAFPSISTGAYHFPVNQAAEIAVKTIGSFLSTNTSLKQVLLVCRDQRTRFIYEVSLQQYQAK